MKKVNFPLVIGIILLILLTLMAFLPEKFTNKDPNFQQQIRTTTVIENGKEVHKVEMNGWGPNEDNIMGTDEFGRDIYSRIVYGTSTTLKAALMIVILRILVSIPIGILAGMGSGFFSSLIKLFNTIFTAIPTLFVAFFILNIRYIQALEVNESIIAFSIVLTFLGWSKLGRQVEERVRKIMNEEFIEGEVAIGKSKFQIAIQNMVPHLIPSLISLVFIEIGLVIFLLAQLSIFNVFVGPRVELVRWGGATPIYSALNPEWGSMLSRLIVHNRTGKFWIGIFPALAFTVGILAFNLTGEGLRIEFEKRTSRVASYIRNIYFLLSPRIYIQQLKNFKDYIRPVAIKSLCIIIIITYIFLPPPRSLYAFNPDSAIEFIEELTQEKYGGRLTGSEGGRLAGEYILEKLKEYGLEPYDGNSYTQTFPLMQEDNESQYEGRNILAVLPGKNWDAPLDRNNKKEVIIIGSAYDGISPMNGNISASRASMSSINLEIARVLSQLEEELDKTVVFAFWDGESVDASGSRYYNSYERYFTQDFYKVYYFDIGPVSDGSTMYISMYSASAFQVETYDINRDINKWLNKKQVKFKSRRSVSSTFYNIGLNMALKLSVDSINYLDMDRENDTVENLNHKLLMNMGQYYIDLITMDENFK